MTKIKNQKTIFHPSNASVLEPQEEIKLFHYMVNHIGDELVLIRPDGTIAYANNSVVKALGCSRNETLKKNVVDLFGAVFDLNEWRTSFFADLKKQGKPVSFEAERYLKGNRTLAIEVTAAYINYGSSEYILAISRDVTSKRSDEEKIRETDKMKALSLFVSGTAQEIKYPLHAILTRIQQMMHKYQNRNFEYIGFKEFTDIMNTIKNISNQVRYCYDITNKLLVLNQKKVGLRQKDCSAAEVIKNSMQLLSQQLSLADVRLKLAISQALPHVATPANELDDVIVNFTMNALQAMPSGGLFTIRVSAERAKKSIRIEFKDDGIGIPKENLPRVFEPFFSTKQRGVGQNAGLGLSIVYSIVKACKGDVTIKSSLRHGTSVVVTLPVSKAYPKIFQKSHK